MLGETPLPAQARSIFDFMSQKDRERLENIRNNLTAGAPKDLPERAPSPPPLHQPGELSIRVNRRANLVRAPCTVELIRRNFSTPSSIEGWITACRSYRSDIDEWI